VQHNMGKQDEEVNRYLVDAPTPHERALRDGMWKGHGGYEIALSPVILGGFGWLLDSVIGTVPVFLIIGAVLGFAGSVANQYYRYQAAMEIETASRLARNPKPVSQATPLLSRSFGRVEPVEVDTSIDFSITDSNEITGQAAS